MADSYRSTEGNQRRKCVVLTKLASFAAAKEKTGGLVSGQTARQLLTN
jgi:hypothetical protein